MEETYFENKRIKPPFPAQHQEAPGVEAEMSPVPEYQGKEYKPSGS